MEIVGITLLISSLDTISLKNENQFANLLLQTV